MAPLARYLILYAAAAAVLTCCSSAPITKRQADNESADSRNLTLGLVTGIHIANRSIATHLTNNSSAFSLNNLRLINAVNYTCAIHSAKKNINESLSNDAADNLLRLTAEKLEQTACELLKFEANNESFPINCTDSFNTDSELEDLCSLWEYIELSTSIVNQLNNKYNQTIPTYCMTKGETGGADCGEWICSSSLDHVATLNADFNCPST